ncbi:MAG: type II toxin-antitoxin system VapC family toxin [Stanieria sp.]
MRYLLDTCVISDFVKGEVNTLQKIKATSPSQLSVSSLTVMEVKYGLHLNPAKAKKIEPITEKLFSQIAIIDFGIKEATTAAEIRNYLKKAGMPIGAYDLLIGATALSNQLGLVTANIKEFERISNLLIENWRL